MAKKLNPDALVDLYEALKEITEVTLGWIKVLSKQEGFLLSAVLMASLKKAQEVLAEAGEK